MTKGVKIAKITENDSQEQRISKLNSNFQNLLAASMRLDKLGILCNRNKKQTDEVAAGAVAAQTAADSAQQSAKDAQTAANNAQIMADAAQSSANEAAAAASNAQTTADNAAKDAQKANEKAQSAATDAAKANIDLSEVKAEVTNIKADSVTLRSDMEGQIETVTTTIETDYAKKTDLSDTEATLRTEISTSAAGITQTVSETYAKKTDVTDAITTAKADLQTQITQNADKISLTAKSVEQAHVDIKANATNITEAKNAAATAQSTANTAKTDAAEAATAAANAQSAADVANTAASNAQTKANEAATAAATAKTAADKAKTDLATAQAKLAEVEANANATAEDLATAQQAVETAQAAADAAQDAANIAQANAATAKSTADTAKANAEAAQTAANTAKTNAANAQKAAEDAQASADAANDALAVLEPRVTAAETAIEQNAEEITLRATKTEMAAVQTKANDAATAAANAQTTANTAKTDAANAQKAADDAASTAATAQTSANTAKSAADAAQKAADDAAADLATAKANLTAVTGRVDATEEDIAAAQAAVEAAQAAADNAASAAATAKSAAATAQSTADTAKANAATAQTTANTAKTNAATAQAAADAAQEAADKAQGDVDSLTTRVTAAETKITQSADAITLRATKTEVSTAKSEAISAAATDATNKANSALSSAKSYTDSVDIGGRNMLLNSGFKGIPQTDERFIDNTYMKYKNNSVKLIADNTSGTSAKFVGIPSLKQSWVLSDVLGKTITISMWIYIENVGDLSGYEFRIIYTTGGVTKWQDPDTRYPYYIPSASKLSAGWNYVYGSFTVAEDSTRADFNFTCYALPGNSGFAWFSSPKAELGNKTTGWTPAPEDQDAATQAVADDLASNYYTKTQTDAQIKVRSDSITSAVASTYQTKAGMGDYSTTEQMNSAIEQKANSITSSVSQTYQVKGDYATKAQAQGYANTAKTEAVSAAAADATSKANAAQANAISTAAEDATTKADAAEEAAKQDTANKLKDYSTTVQMNSAIQQKADSITSTVAETYQPKGDYVTGTEAYSQLKQTVSGLNSTVQSHTGSISNLQQTAEGIKVRLDNQQTVRNLVSKSRLLDGWGHVVSAGVTMSKNVSTSAPEFGEVTVARFNASTANPSDQSSYIHMTNAARVTSGSKYTLSVWARKVSGENARPILALTTTNQSAIITENLTTEWKRYSYTFTLGTVGTGKYVDITTSFGVSVLAGQTGVFEVCCPQLEAGDTMNPWSANSVDTTDYMSFSTEGLVIGDMTGDTLQGNVKVDSDSVDIRIAEDTVTSFGSYPDGWLYDNEMPYSELTSILRNLLVQSEGELAILHSYPNSSRNNLNSHVWLGDASIALHTEDSALASDYATEIVLEGNGRNKITIRAEDGNNGYGTIDMIGNVVINPNGSSFNPYYASGTTAVTRLFTAGYVTSSKTQVVFTIPIERYCTYRTVSITSASGGSFKLRQNGNYTHGSSSSKLVNPKSYTATHRGKYITVVAEFGNTTNAVNNAPVGIEFSGNLTFS